MKRIREIIITRFSDTDPDTSYLGEYSNSINSDFSIDRAHTVECASQRFSLAHATADKLERALRYLDEQRFVKGCTETQESLLEDAMGILEEAQEELLECDCELGFLGRNEYKYLGITYLTP